MKIVEPRLNYDSISHLLKPTNTGHQRRVLRPVLHLLVVTRHLPLLPLVLLLLLLRRLLHGRRHERIISVDIPMWWWLDMGIMGMEVGSDGEGVWRIVLVMLGVRRVIRVLLAVGWGGNLFLWRCFWGLPFDFLLFSERDLWRSFFCSFFFFWFFCVLLQNPLPSFVLFFVTSTDSRSLLYSFFIQQPQLVSITTLTYNYIINLCNFFFYPPSDHSFFFILETTFFFLYYQKKNLTPSFLKHNVFLFFYAFFFLLCV